MALPCAGYKQRTVLKLQFVLNQLHGAVIRAQQRFKLLMRTLHEFGSRMANSKFPTSQSWPPLLLHLRMKGGGI
ncbi:hypothetical protein SORBI_3003G216100 [Sorghum bicolor]|uniref:Uncharacterized protein n=1 Tax=Sorghum bicolor TaxID=4558 RepID=A0A1B6Q4L5_SORBI|nr:hypothetical protein SORBI_3003G216100 [Sorghum bicolor]